MILSVTNDLTDLMFLNELFSTGISDFNAKLFTSYLPQWHRRGQNPPKIDRVRNHRQNVSKNLPSHDKTSKNRATREFLFMANFAG